jgi:hypothetical protein
MYVQGILLDLGPRVLLVSQGLIAEASLSHSDTPHDVILLWTSGQTEA